MRPHTPQGLGAPRPLGYSCDQYQPPTPRLPNYVKKGGHPVVDQTAQVVASRFSQTHLDVRLRQFNVWPKHTRPFRPIFVPNCPSFLLAAFVMKAKARYEAIKNGQVFLMELR